MEEEEEADELAEVEAYGSAGPRDLDDGGIGPGEGHRVPCGAQLVTAATPAGSDAMPNDEPPSNETPKHVYAPLVLEYKEALEALANATNAPLPQQQTPMLAAGVPILPGVPVPATDDPLFRRPAGFSAGRPPSARRMRWPLRGCRVRHHARHSVLTRPAAASAWPPVRVGWRRLGRRPTRLSGRQRGGRRGESSGRAMLASLPTAVSARIIVSFGYVGQRFRASGNDTNGDNMPKAGGEVARRWLLPRGRIRSTPCATSPSTTRARSSCFCSTSTLSRAPPSAPRCARKHALHACLSTSRSAIVVPAFECALGGGGGGLLGEAKEEARLPATKQELESLIDAGKRVLFHVGHFPKGHRATDLARWRQANGAYEIRYEEYFEPYVIASRRFLPRYDERFVGYGLNKVSHLYQCAAEGFSFAVLPDHFVIANEHEKSSSWRLIFGDKRDPACRRRKQHLAELYRAFKGGPAAAATAARQGGGDGRGRRKERTRPMPAAVLRRRRRT